MITPNNDRTIRVFLSSTFRDFAEERDLLVRKVFPELRRKCRERQVELVDVDLRWGITEMEAQQGKVLPICMAEIDRSRPWFMGFIGERYGWVPAPEQYDSAIIQEQPWLEEHRGSKSVTELEILHGVLNNPAMEGRAFFYFRDTMWSRKLGGDFLCEGTEEKAKLEALKDRIRKSGFPVLENYPSPEALAGRVKEDLWKLIDEAYPESEVPDALTRERMAHEAYGTTRCRLYLGGEGYFKALDDAMKAKEYRPVLITGQSGGGKSALVANWANKFRRENPNAFVLTHFLAVGAYAANPVGLTTRLVEELARFTGEYLVLEGDPRKASHMFSGWLQKAGKFAVESGKLFVLVVDALDKLSDVRDLEWWPRHLPEGIRLVVTCLKGGALDTIRTRMDWHEIEVTPMAKRDCEIFIAAHLANYRKSLPPEMVAIILAHPLCGNPLFLHTILEELRVFGVHEELSEKLQYYLASQTIVDLFEKVLERVEDDNTRDAVCASMELLWAAKERLSEDNLLQATGLAPAVWASIHTALDGSLISASGSVAFSHDYLHKAVQNRYLHDDISQMLIHRKMADFCSASMRFRKKEVSNYVRRHSVEHFIDAGDWDNTTAYLCDIEFIEARAIAEEISAMLMDYARAIDLHPEGEKERQASATRQAELERYAKEIHEYAAAWSSIREFGGEVKPTQPRSVGSDQLWTSNHYATEYKRMTATPNRLDILKAFRVFVARNSAELQAYSKQVGYVANLARNDAPAGPVHEEGKRHLDPLKCVKLIKRFTPSAAFNPLPPCQAVLATSSRTTSVALSADCRFAVSGSVDSTLRVWNLATGECLRVLEGHADRINSVALSADGRIAVSGSEDKTLRLWDLPSGECLRVLKGHEAAITSVALTADGRFAVSGSADITLRVWHLDSGECLMISEFVHEQGRNGHVTEINSVALSVDGRVAVSGSGNFDGWDGTLCIWNLASFRPPFNRARTLHPSGNPIRRGKPIKILEDCHDGAITSLALSLDGKLAVSGSDDYALCVWNLESGACIKVLNGHKDKITSVALSSDGRLAVSAGWDRTLRLWNLDSGECLRILEVEGYNGVINSISMSADGRVAVSGLNDNTIRVWNLDYTESLRAQEDHAGTISGLSLSADGRIALSTGKDNKLRIWDPENGECLKILDGHDGEIRAIDLTADSRLAVSVSFEEIIGKHKSVFKDSMRVWNLDSGECIKVLEVDACGVIRLLSLSADGRLAVTVDYENTPRSWNLESGECLKFHDEHEGLISSLVLSADGRIAVSGSWDKNLRVWNLVNGECLRVLEGHTDTINSVALSTEGRIAVSGSFDKTLRVWDLVSGECLRILEGHEAAITCVVTSLHCRLAVSASHDKNLRVWNLDSGECLKILKGHEGYITHLFLSADAKLAISVSGGDFSADDTLRIWNIEAGKCLAKFYIRGISRFTLHPSFSKMLIGYTSGRVESFGIEI